MGSTRVKGSETESFVYNQALLRHCSNTAEVSGYRMVGGLIGEAQAGLDGSYNKGNVSATNDYVGGICGNSSVGVIQNTVNAATVSGNAYVGGIIGKTTWGSISNNQNLGAVQASSGHVGGILALGGNNTMIHYCSNFGPVIGNQRTPAGGIVGEIGDPRKWTALNVVECVIGSMEIVMGVAGPVLAIAEEAMAEAVEIVIGIVEKGLEISLLSSDYVLFTYGLYEMISPELEEELSEEMKVVSQDIFTNIDGELAALRSGISGDTPLFPGTSWNRYVDNINGLALACADEEVNKEFTEAINEAREERAESMEKVAEAKEIVHTVVAGVAIAASTVALIGGTIATGGTATALLVVGTAASIVGGANALVKTCSEFEHNAVIISQCVNAASVTCTDSSETSSIAGKICDAVIINDCLSTAPTSEGFYGFFVGKVSNHNEINRCVSAINRNRASMPDACHGCLVSVDNGDDNLLPVLGVNYVAPNLLSDPKSYEVSGFKVGEDEVWNLPADMPFAIPGKSCYLK